MLALSILEILLHLSEHRQEKAILTGPLVPSPIIIQSGTQTKGTGKSSEHALDFLHGADPTPPLHSTNTPE